MKITIESTSKIVQLDGANGRMPARVWQGHTESGIPVHCFVTLVAVERNEDTSQFDSELQEQAPPSAAVASYPARLVL